MGACVLLLRGVNVSGANRLPMAELREMLTGLGLEGVRTHIQSGNAVFHDPGAAGGWPTGSVPRSRRASVSPRRFFC